ncbi:MAG: hypothetical protein R2793_04035 [Flavobacteriaceae bacterium]
MSATDGKITLQQAIDWTTDYRNNEVTSARAFLIPIQDLQGALAEIQGQTGSPMVRAYLALDPSTNEEKLVIVGTSQEVQRDGSIIYRDLLPDAGVAVEDSSNSIYDFTKPCPTWCDDNSPLN